MKKPMVRVHNSTTNEMIDREMTDDEFAQYKKDLANDAAKKQAILDAENKKILALQKLEALGLDQADLKALGL
jgi:hypothetical protein